MRESTTGYRHPARECAGWLTRAWRDLEQAAAQAKDLDPQAYAEFVNLKFAVQVQGHAWRRKHGIGPDV